LLTQTFFERLYVDQDDVTEVRYQPPFDELHAASRTWRTTVASDQTVAPGQTKSPDTSGVGALPGSWADLLAAASDDTVWSKTALVEVAGIEPASSGATPGLLRAQFALPLLDPTDHANKSV